MDTKQTTVGPRLGLSNEIIYILAGQGATKLQETKVEGPENEH